MGVICEIPVTNITSNTQCLNNLMGMYIHTEQLEHMSHKALHWGENPEKFFDQDVFISQYHYLINFFNLETPPSLSDVHSSLRISRFKLKINCDQDGLHHQTRTQRAEELQVPRGRVHLHRQPNEQNLVLVRRLPPSVDGPKPSHLHWILLHVILLRDIYNLRLYFQG